MTNSLAAQRRIGRLAAKTLNLPKDTLVWLIGDSKAAVGVAANGYLSLCVNLFKKLMTGCASLRVLSQG